MTKITIDLDDRLAERLAAVSRARDLTVEQWFRAEAERAAQAVKKFEIENSSHRLILGALERPEGYYDSPTDKAHDRERHRAEAYSASRKALLELVDNTEGDMGAQSWNRSALYDS